MIEGRQNLLSSKYLLNYYIETFVRTLVYFILLIVLVFAGFFGVNQYLNGSIETMTRDLGTVVSERNIYLEKKQQLDNKKVERASIGARLSEIEALNVGMSQFDLFMCYIINLKPYNVAIISIEDMDIMPESASNSSVGQSNNIVEIIDESIDFSLEADGEDNVSNGNDVIESIQMIQPPSNVWNPNKFDNTLTYSRDIGGNKVIIRGYGDKISSVSEYIKSIALTPEINGYEIEGIEDKVTQVDGTNIILFEICLDMKGGS